MKFGIITYIEHKEYEKQYYSYSPYIDEMNLWLKYANSALVLAPKFSQSPDDSETSYATNPDFIEVPALNFSSTGEALRSTFKTPGILMKIWKVCKDSDHIHLRCPGNISLLGCIVQIFFPKKPKTVKYAGNWDPASKQPGSYRFQKWILSNTFLSRNMKVLVYGKWPKQSTNIVPFFTASYSEKEIQSKEKVFSGVLNFIFVGSLSEGKEPLKAIKIVQFLRKNGLNVNLRLYGEGILKNEIEDYISTSGSHDYIMLKGFVKKEKLKKIYQDSHFLLLPSRSEGWPKAVAEAMFFGCIPVSTPVSCVPWMLGNENRGILIEPEPAAAGQKILDLIKDKEKLKRLSENAKNWSRQYTLERFESEISKLL
ncbi:glycosyltransferase family 4 protein [Zunongwangia sp. F363]|uniref:Glycosyltransferase family 4 protein n=1 Tax=Autumnicola tepida TaxID=3075595 RepID=A0ABU3C9L9_9FLAO|nr:glycosyltransferase family 4 protein [Zunongwangia sp. F363]MDT0643028.1 glycosyltransferase family 4 protein [Zunongwangia sp. F363]